MPVSSGRTSFCPSPQEVHAPDEVRGATPPRAGHVRLPLGQGRCPTGYTKYRWEDVKSDKQNLRLAPNKVEYTEPVWLAFDPEHGRCECPRSFWGLTDIAASEAFSALIQFPEWPLRWFKNASAPNLSGYQLKYDGNWSRVPCLDRCVDDRQLGLGAGRVDFWSGGTASPSVREC